MAKNIDYQSLLIQNNFESFLLNIIQTEKNLSKRNYQIEKAAEEILFEIRGNKNIVKKFWYNALYEKYQFKLEVQPDKPPLKYKAILYSYKTIIIPGGAVVTQTRSIGPILIPTPAKVTVYYGKSAYKKFQGKTTSNSTTCINGGAEVKYSYTSVSAGSGTAIFYSAAHGCSENNMYGVSLTITACLPSDATSFILINGNDLVSGTGPRQTPSATNDACVPAPVLLTYVGNTMDSLISSL
jgi:hypothetical protein